MAKYLIRWDAGYGESYFVEEFDTPKQAEDCAEEQWRDEVESSASFEALELTPELIEEYHLDT